MSYLNVDVDYFRHEKTLRLEFALGPGSNAIPIKLWSLAATSCPLDGIFKNITSEELENLLGWWGEKGNCCIEMMRLGFLEKNGSDFMVHNWKNHQGHLIAFKKRSQIANRKRWNKLGVLERSLSDPRAILERSLSDPPNLTFPNHTILKKNTPLPPLGVDIDFDTFWKSYPKKTGKGAASKAWKKLKPNLEICLKSLSIQKKSSQWLKDNGQFIPLPATWINQERWNDEVQEDKKDYIMDSIESFK